MEPACSQKGVVPDQLCSYCKAFVRQAECLNHLDLEELTPNLNDCDYPFLYIIDHYPGVQTLACSATEECHFCSIVLDRLQRPRSTLGEDMPEDEILRREEQLVFSTIRLSCIDPGFWQVTFSLGFHSERPTKEYKIHFQRS
jgi:hypothetical protein